MKKTNLINTLQNIGLSEKEAIVYIVLLELRESLPSTIARRTDLKRSTVYSILGVLQKKGLVSSIKRTGNTYFQAQDPQLFLNKQRTQLDQLTTSIKDLETAIPELRSLHTDFMTTPQMSVFYGKEGLIQIMEDTLTTSTELLCWVNITMATKTVLEDYYPTYISKKIKKQIPLKGIFCYDKQALQFKKQGLKELREIYLIPKNEFPFKNEINIYDDKVAIISHEDKTGVIIQNKNIADTQRSIFKLGLKYAKLIESKTLKPADIEYLQSKTKPEKTVLQHIEELCTCPDPTSPCLTTIS